MSKKTLAMFAVIMIVVFSITVIVYPLLFTPENKAVPVGEPSNVAAPLAPPAGL